MEEFEGILEIPWSSMGNIFSLQSRALKVTFFFFQFSQKFYNYRKSSIRSRPCIILDSNFLRLVLEVIQKPWILQQNFFLGVKKGPQKSLKMPKKYSYNGK